MSNLLVQNIKHTNGTLSATVSSGGVFSSPGHTIQTAQTVSRTSVSSTSTSYVEASTNFRASITPKYPSSKLLITATLGLTAYNNSGTNCTVWAKLYDVANSANISNGETPIRGIDYGTSGIMFSNPVPLILLQDFPNSNEITITWYYKRESGTAVSVLANDDHRTTQILLQEIAV